MKIFVTGASGWIGSAAVAELVVNGHDVAGLVRSDASATKVERLGARAHRGDLDDLDSLRAGAAAADAVLHLADKHDWDNPAETDRTERAAVEAMLGAIAGANKTFLVANALSGIAPGRAALETDASPAVAPTDDRGGSENLVLNAEGVRGLAIRFPPSVHGAGDWGFVAFLADIAQKSGKSAYVDDGSTVWSAVHRGDAARLIRLGLEQAPAGTRLHAVAEQDIPTRDIAAALGQALGVPVESVGAADADEHFGFLASFFGTSMTASSEATQALLDWTPTGPTLVEDILAGSYTQAQ